MARVALLCPDLLFGSKVEGTLGAAGHEVTRVDSVDAARYAAGESDLLVVDLTDPEVDGTGFIAEVKAKPELDGLPALGFYSHVDQDTRRRAEQAGFDMVVPRSRMAREMTQIVERLLTA
jgi:CheY-like chemotaxis protein